MVIHFGFSQFEKKHKEHFVSMSFKKKCTERSEPPSFPLKIVLQAGITLLFQTVGGGGGMALTLRGHGQMGTPCYNPCADRYSLPTQFGVKFNALPVTVKQ